MNNRLVSIIIPAYCAEEFITRCVQSCIEQTYSYLEIIAINDGSKDSTLSLLKSIDDDRIKIIDKQNEGVGRARNDGLKQATGDYVLFLDADDYLPKNAIATLVNAAKANDADFVFGGYTIETHSGLKHVKPKYNKKLDILDNFYIDNIVSSPWAKLFKRDIIHKYSIEFENFKIMQDSIFNLRYLCHVNPDKFVKLDQPLYVYNKLSEGTTANLNDEKINAIEQSLTLQESIYTERRKNSNLKVDNHILLARRYLLQFVFAVNSNVKFSRKKIIKELRYLLPNPFLSTKVKVELFFYLLGDSGHKAFIYFVNLLKK